MIDWGTLNKEANNNYLSTILPEAYDYKVESFHLGEISEIDCETSFRSTFRVNVKQEGDVHKWLNNFYNTSSTFYNSFTGDRTGTGKKCIISCK